jgi:hypothetical protein
MVKMVLIMVNKPFSWLVGDFGAQVLPLQLEFEVRRLWTPKESEARVLGIV